MRFSEILAAFSDEAAYAISPRWGISRIAARRRRELAESIFERRQQQLSGAGGYASAERSADQYNWLISKLSPQSGIEEDRETMIERTDSAAKNYELADGHVFQRRIHVVGCGMSPDPVFDAEELGISLETIQQWRKIIRRDWGRWAMHAGSRGEAMYEIQQLMQEYWERRGEWFLLIGDEVDPMSPNTLRIEVIDPDRVETPPGMAANPRVRQGVETDTSGKVIAYYIRETVPGDTLEVSEEHVRRTVRFPNGLPQVIHHFEWRFAGQHRGYPRMQVGTRRLKNVEDYGDSERERNYVAACHAAFVKSDLPPEGQMASDGVVTNASGERVRDMTPAQIHYMGIADDVKFSDPSGPPNTYNDYVGHENRMFCAGTGGVMEMITGDWSGISYSGGKIVWNGQESTLDVLQKGHAKTIAVIYAHFVLREVTDGRLPIDLVAFRSSPWSYTTARMIPPKRSSIDPAREDRNELMKIEARTKPASDFVERQNGQPADEVYDRIEQDEALRASHGFPESMPMMGRDGGNGEGNAPTQPGDSNEAASDAANAGAV